MKVLDKIALALFSCIMLIISIFACLAIFGWVDLAIIYKVIRTGLENESVSNIILGLSIAFILIAIKAIFFGGDSKEKKNDVGSGILMENQDGKLLITKDTIENLVNSVAKGFESTQNVSTKVMLDKENNILVEVILFVLPSTVIKDLSVNLQSRIKEVIKTTTDLEVKEIIIKVKNITPKQDVLED